MAHFILSQSLKFNVTLKLAVDSSTKNSDKTTQHKIIRKSLYCNTVDLSLAVSTLVCRGSKGECTYVKLKEPHPG